MHFAYFIFLQTTYFTCDTQTGVSYLLPCHVRYLTRLFLSTTCIAQQTSTRPNKMAQKVMMSFCERSLAALVGPYTQLQTTLPRPEEIGSSARTLIDSAISSEVLSMNFDQVPLDAKIKEIAVSQCNSSSSDLSQTRSQARAFRMGNRTWPTIEKSEAGAVFKIIEWTPELQIALELVQAKSPSRGLLSLQNKISTIALSNDSDLVSATPLMML